jgi:hypothetical protein
MAGQAMFLIGNTAEIDRNIGDDFGMLSPVRIMQSPIFSPAPIGYNEHQT